MWNEDGEWVEDPNPWQRHEGRKPPKPIEPPLIYPPYPPLPYYARPWAESNRTNADIIGAALGRMAWRSEPVIDAEQAEELQRWFDTGSIQQER